MRTTHPHRAPANPRLPPSAGAYVGSAALGRARYAIRYLIEFGSFSCTPWVALSWQPGGRGHEGKGGTSGD